MTPIDYYHEQCNQAVISADPLQLVALQQLQKVYDELVPEQKKRSGLFNLFYKKKLIKGVYLWGSVGIGKTFLMDCFYHSLPFEQKLRMHFHQFMQRIHEQLKKHQGEVDPLQAIAADLAKENWVICFDEFFVSDIADAMLLGRLLKALFEQGVTLVATSNTQPDDLYKNGLQRLQFLPAIALIKKNTDVVHITSVIDYRLRYLQAAGVFYTPLNQLAEENMQKTFKLLTHGQPTEESTLFINDRQVHYKKRTDNIIWFDFADICHIPRSQQDYLVIAEQYHTVFISDIPVIPEEARDVIVLFIKMVDVFYDAHVRLVISAAASVSELYVQGHMISEYTRTRSRLLEMQSMDYFNKEDNITHDK